MESCFEGEFVTNFIKAACTVTRIAGVGAKFGAL